MDKLMTDMSLLRPLELKYPSLNFDTSVRGLDINLYHILKISLEEIDNYSHADIVKLLKELVIRAHPDTVLRNQDTNLQNLVNERCSFLNNLKRIFESEEFYNDYKTRFVRTTDKRDDKSLICQYCEYKICYSPNLNHTHGIKKNFYSPPKFRLKDFTSGLLKNYKKFGKNRIIGDF